MRQGRWRRCPRVGELVHRKSTGTGVFRAVAEQLSKLLKTIGSGRTDVSELVAGDFMGSGTPENVGLVATGSVIRCHMDGRCTDKHCWSGFGVRLQPCHTAYVSRRYRPGCRRKRPTPTLVGCWPGLKSAASSGGSSTAVVSRYCKAAFCATCVCACSG